MPTHVRTGRAGENISAGIISTLQDVDVNIVQQPHYDLLAHVNERDLKIQVKTASVIQNNPRTCSYEHFNFKTTRGVKPHKPLDPTKFDILCMVALPYRLCLFRMSETVTTTTIKIKTGLFSVEAERDSWEDCIRQIIGNKK